MIIIKRANKNCKTKHINEQLKINRTTVHQTNFNSITNS